MAKQKSKLSREELERDEVADSFEAALESVRRNRIRLAVASAVILAVAVSAYFYSENKRQVQTQFSGILNTSAAIFDEIPKMQDEAQRETRLKDTLKTLQTQIVDRDPTSEAAEEAVHLIGRCYYALDDTTKAAESFNKYLTMADNEQEKARGQIALAYAQENAFYFTTDQARLNEALETFRLAKATAEPRSYLYYSALIGEARLLELLGKDPEALEIYKRVMEERPSPVEVADNSEPPAGFNPSEYARRMINQTMSTLGFAATAKMRAQVLESASKTVNGAVPLAILTADRATSPTLAAGGATSPTQAAVAPPAPAAATAEPAPVAPAPAEPAKP